MATSPEPTVPPTLAAPPDPDTGYPAGPDTWREASGDSLSEAERRRTNHAPPDPAVLFGFVQEGSVYIASTPGGREWRISQELTGWRLEFRDSGDKAPTNAGVHPSVEAAMKEARR